jgi:S-adenosylhomocysteine hydrolase
MQVSPVNWDETLLVGNQHLLPSSGALVNSLLSLGVPPANLIFTGKVYSCRSDVVTWLKNNKVHVISPTAGSFLPGTLVARHMSDLAKFWHYVEDVARSVKVKRIVLLDDGGYGLLSMPAALASKCSVTVVEQTMSGLKNGEANARLRRINLAASAAKVRLESPFIADAISRAMAMDIPGREAPIGIVGMGNVGKALGTCFESMGHKVFFFDTKRDCRPVNERVNRLGSLKELCEKCSIVVGCTGEDIFGDADWIGSIGKVVTLISASSQDIEFRTLLKMAPRVSIQPGADVTVSVGNAVYRVLFSGFPINFSGTSEIEQPRDIQLTRALLLGSVLQALSCDGQVNSRGDWLTAEQLNDALQRFVVRTWSDLTGVSNASKGNFESLQWIKENSCGVAAHCEELSTVFGA